jgi:hypothetical protein
MIWLAPAYRAPFSKLRGGKSTQKLHEFEQSQLDNIARDLLTSGILKHYIDKLSLTGKALAALLTVNIMPEATVKALAITAKSARSCRLR